MCSACNSVQEQQQISICLRVRSHGRSRQWHSNQQQLFVANTRHVYKQRYQQTAKCLQQYTYSTFSPFSLLNCDNKSHIKQMNISVHLFQTCIQFHTSLDALACLTKHPVVMVLHSFHTTIISQAVHCCVVMHYFLRVVLRIYTSHIPAISNLYFPF